MRSLHPLSHNHANNKIFSYEVFTFSVICMGIKSQGLIYIVFNITLLFRHFW